MLYQGACKPCRVEQQRDRLKDPIKRKEHQARVLAHKHGLVELTRTAKDKPCDDCGKRFPHYVMDLDHVRGKKVGNVSNLIRRGSRRIIEAEIRKCDVVCADCHRERTHGKR